MSLDTTYQGREFKSVGTRPLRPDGVDKVTGRARYGADFNMPGQLVGRVLRSPHAHARILRIDTSLAEALRGVKAVVTAADLPDLTDGNRGLFKVLDNWNRDFLVGSNAIMIDLRRGDVIRTPRVHVNLSELLLAHELVDGAGDYYQKVISGEAGLQKTVRIRAFFNGAVSVEGAGRIRPGAYDGAGFERRFFVMEECAVRGLDTSLSAELELVSNLPYAILNRQNIAYLYDFSGSDQ